MRRRLYESYVSTHTGVGDSDSVRLVYRRDIRPALPSATAGPVLDIGCGQGDLVRLLLADGYDTEGIDISPEQVALANASGLSQVKHGDFHDRLSSNTETYGAVIATDVLEHLAKDEVLRTFELVRQALRPGGLFVARVPNAISPFGGRIRHGDFTHESSFTPRSLAQLAYGAGFTGVDVSPCPPIAHGLMSAIRVLIWKPISGLFKLALAAETGVVRGHVVTQNMTFVTRVPNSRGES